MAQLFSPTIENAIRLSNYWHQGQTRHGSEFDYFSHLSSVAMLLARAQFDEEVIAAGYCHDLLEDTECPEEEIAEACGERVLRIVEAVSEDSHFDELQEWEARKKAYIETVRQGPWESKAVCVADKLHNLHDLLAHCMSMVLSSLTTFIVVQKKNSGSRIKCV